MEAPPEVVVVENTKEKCDKGGDVETGGGGPAPLMKLYPKMAEDPRIRWAFIRKVYGILTVQMLITVGISAVVVFVRPIPAFFLKSSRASWTVFIVILLLPFIVMWPMAYYRKRHPINLFLLVLFTLCISMSTGLISATLSGKVVLEAAILSCTVVVVLTLYTFWAARKGYDFQFLFPFLFVSLIALLVYLLIQLKFPMGRVSYTIYSFLATLVFSGLIIFHTDDLIKRHSCDEYVDAAISLYLCVINLFNAQVLGISGFC